MERTNECVETIKCAEKTILAILIYNNETTNTQAETIFNYIKDDMFLNSDRRKMYKVFKDTYQVNKAIYGTKQFSEMFTQICLMENIKDCFSKITSLEKYWSPTQTIPYWIEKIQNEYFTYRYSIAKTKL